jgi:argininosuccinate synthase
MKSIEDLDLDRDYDGIALYSGGTDSTLAPLLAREHVGDNILLVMIDLGESEASLAQAAARADIIGWDFLLLDERENFGAEILAEAVQMRASYWGYPLGTPLGRAFQLGIASKIISALNSQRRRTRYVVHGCAAKQNTRYRIERYLSTLTNVEPAGPFTSRIVSRQEKVSLLSTFGIEAVPGDGVATDQNIYCRAMEGDLLNSFGAPAALPIYNVVADPLLTDSEESLVISFESGIPVAVDGVQGGVADIVQTCAERGARAGVGRICVFEDTIPELGYKERGIYEAPAAVVLAVAHAYLEGATMGKLERTQFRTIRHSWAEVVYRGDWHTSERAALGDEGRRLNEPVTGSVSLTLRYGAINLGEAECPRSLLVSTEASRGAY